MQRARAMARGRCLTMPSDEDAVGLLIDDLLALGEGELDGAVQTLMGLRANESVLFDAVRKILLDDAGSLILPVRLVRCRPDPVALVFDRRCSRCVGFRRRSAHAGEASP